METKRTHTHTHTHLISNEMYNYLQNVIGKPKTSCNEQSITFKPVINHHKKKYKSNLIRPSNI